MEKFKDAFKYMPTKLRDAIRKYIPDFGEGLTLLEDVNLEEVEEQEGVEGNEEVEEENKEVEEGEGEEGESEDAEEGEPSNE